MMGCANDISRIDIRVVFRCWETHTLLMKSTSAGLQQQIANIPNESTLNNIKLSELL